MSVDMPAMKSHSTPLQKTSEELAAEIAVKPAMSSTVPPLRGTDRLIEAIKRERTDLVPLPARTRTFGADLRPFNAFIDRFLATPPKDWGGLFAQSRLSTQESESSAKSYARYYLEAQTNAQGLGKAENGRRYLALVSACLLGYDLDALWFGTALKGLGPAEAKLWRALSRNVPE